MYFFILFFLLVQSGAIHDQTMWFGNTSQCQRENSQLSTPPVEKNDPIFTPGHTHFSTQLQRKNVRAE